MQKQLYFGRKCLLSAETSLFLQKQAGFCQKNLLFRLNTAALVVGEPVHYHL